VTALNTAVRYLWRHALVRFAFIGGCGYVLAIALLAFFTTVPKLAFAEANALTIFLTMIFTWLGNRYLTFRARRARSLSGIAQEALKFMGANAVGAGVNYGVSVAMVHFAHSPLDNKFIAQACGVLAGLIFNFTLSSKLVFRGPA
jgi:putative flippase GtrA